MDKKNDHQKPDPELQAQTREEFYKRLREELEKTHDWPVRYMFKFILPNEEENIRKARERFADIEHDYKQNYSRNGKYVSLSFIARMNNPDEIISRYRKMEDIPGLIAI